MEFFGNKLEVFDNIIEDAPVHKADEVIDLDHTPLKHLKLSLNMLVIKPLILDNIIETDWWNFLVTTSS